MDKKSFLFLTLIVFIVIPFQLVFLFKKDVHNPPGVVAGIKTIYPGDVENSLSIGENNFHLYGYTSPQALVTLEGAGILNQTAADDRGYFQFNTHLSPFSKREACLSAKDQFGRLSSPVCLAPFPVNYNADIGPVIMPPTISLDKKNYFIGDQVILSGQTVPNTDVKLSVFGDNKNKFEVRNTKIETNSNFKIRILKFFSDFGFRISSFAFIKPVEAFTFPQLEIKPDSKGNFSINLPSSNPDKFRLFAQTNFKKSLSANSIKLNFDILPIWMIIIQFFLFIFSLLKPRLFEISIVMEITIVLYFLKEHFKNKTIVLYQRNLPALKQKKALAIKKEAFLSRIAKKSD